MADAKTIATRIVFGLIMGLMVGVVLLLEYLDVPANLAGIHGLVLAAAMAAAGVLGFYEVRRLARSAGADVLPVSGLLGVLALGTLPVWRQCLPFGLLVEDVLFGLAVIVMSAFLEQMVRHRVEGAIARVGATLLAVLYLGAGAAVVLAVRLDRGVPALVLFLAAVKSTDIGAYFTGTAIGRHKLIAWLSPGKTWEGLAGGLAAAAGVSALVAWLWRGDAALGRLGPAQAAAFGAIVGLVGQFGDLCESLLKRGAGVKDSGALVPQFGGVLDIIDSPLLAAPAAYLLLNVMP